MHHRRSRTSRREAKRLDDKSYRQAEKRALAKGAADHPPQDSWGYRPEPLPLGDVPCNGKRHGKKKVRKPKEKCPINGTHEWYREDSVHESAINTWYGVYRWTESVTEHTCIHCWKVKLVRYRHDVHTYRNRKRTFPKRPVKF